MAETPLRDAPEIVLVCDGMEFPEGPAYDGRGSVFVSNCSSDYITKVAADETVTKKWMTASEDDHPFTYKKTNGMAFYKDGSLFACDFGRRAVIRILPDQRCMVFADNCNGVPFKGPNDLAFDPKGHLYFTDPSESGKNNLIGAVYRVESGTRRVTKVAGGMAFPNGIAFTADAKHLYVCESQENRIVRFAVKPDGSLGPMEPFCDLSPAGRGEPDGMAVDVKGNLWITHYGAHHAVIADPKGKIVRAIPLKNTQEGGPTNIEFAGKDLKTVYVTDPGANGLWKMRSEVAGLPLFCAPPNKA